MASLSSGETSLTTLLTTLNPILKPATYVFANIPGPIITNLATYPSLVHYAYMIFYELHRDSTTLILPEDVARNSTDEVLGLEYEFECRQITIDIHSGLGAVGFLPVLTSALAARGISCNANSAFYSDHLFVPADRAEEAVQTLLRVRDDARAKAASEAR